MSVSQAELEGLEQERVLFRASDIRQYVYCPRIIYFNYVLPVPRRRTVKMETGQTTHIEFADLEKRRTFSRYRLEAGEREFRVQMRCPVLGLTGVLDMLITTPDGLYPVEFKDTAGGMGLHHKYQLVAYAMMLEETRKRPVRAGFIYAIQGKRVYAVAADQGSRMYVRRVLGAIRNMASRRVFPAKTRAGGRCRDCEFRNYCRGV